MSLITEAHGNLLDAEAEALVNTVNTVGVMGKGIALQFKRAFPANFKAYEAACRRDEVQLGAMLIHDTGKLTENPRFIINFPTKKHWRSKSRLADIQAGLDDLVRVVKDLGITSVAVPPLGCGHGGLKWSQVEPLIRESLGPLDAVSILLFPPVGTPSSTEMPDRTQRPRLTRVRAAIIRTLDKYLGPFGSGATPIETQKMAYFLERFGEPLDLRYSKALYGPYSERLQHVLQDLEGHYISGVGDRSKKVMHADPILVSPGASEEAAELLSSSPEAESHIQRTLAFLDGYDSPYGTELLATVDWAATREGARTTADALRVIRGWNRRKARLFTEHHVELALGHLREAELVTD